MACCDWHASQPEWTCHSVCYDMLWHSHWHEFDQLGTLNPAPLLQLALRGDLMAPAYLQDLVARCDVVTINCPLHKSTKGMFNKDLLAKMKKGAYLVNTARGERQSDLCKTRGPSCLMIAAAAAAASSAQLQSDGVGGCMYVC